MRIIDSHSHLNLPEFKKDLLDVIKRAVLNQVVHCVVVGISPSTNKKALDLAEKFPKFISAAVGFHPHEVKSVKEEQYEDLEIQGKKAVAIGEIGLDWVKEYSPRDLQVIHFKKQLELAKKLAKPVILHLRGDDKLWETALSILKDFLPLKFVAHCFSGDVELAKKVLDLGGKISIPGIVTFKNADALREAARYVPCDRLMIETDCPFLAPVPVRGKRNEPAFLKFTLSAIAQVKQKGEDLVAEEIFHSTCEFFNLNPDEIGNTKLSDIM